MPVLIDVPKKDRLLVDFSFGKEITNKELISVEKKAKNIINKVISRQSLTNSEAEHTATEDAYDNQQRWI